MDKSNILTSFLFVPIFFLLWELFASYEIPIQSITQEIDDEILTEMGELCRRCQSYVAVPILLREAKDIFTAVVILDRQESQRVHGHDQRLKRVFNRMGNTCF